MITTTLITIAWLILLYVSYIGLNKLADYLDNRTTHNKKLQRNKTHKDYLTTYYNNIKKIKE